MQVMRSCLVLVLLAAILVCLDGPHPLMAQPAGATTHGATDPASRQRQLDGWWARQRDKEAADRFWNGPREQRRALTRDQIELWERQRDRRLGRLPYPF